MALFETKVTFKTYELLCDMLELSNYNFNRFSRNHNYMFGNIYEHIPKFNTGRQTAKTSAIVKYIENHVKERTLVVVHNGNMYGYYANKLRDTHSNAHIVTCGSCRPLQGIDFDTIIFDELSKEEILWFLGKYEYLFRKELDKMKMVAIVR